MEPNPRAPRYQYALSELKSGFFVDGLDTGQLEQVLVQAGDSGWRLATTINAGVNGRSNRLILVFERPL